MPAAERYVTGRAPHRGSYLKFVVFHAYRGHNIEYTIDPATTVETVGYTVILVAQFGRCDCICLLTTLSSL